ncbi:MAG: NAD-dependent epimerase/dehydratase family protein [Elusimicrobia bacterium]|nr:NAD-dependent epimerase/dehydratase family protein [Elusimicrobiota bacterium]
MRIVVTGAGGFIGRHLCRALKKSGFQVLGCVMEPEQKAAIREEVEVFVSGKIDGSTAWHNALKKDDIVVHLAARVHVMRETASDPLEAFRRVNVTGTENLARQAAAAGATRIVFMSTVGVNGNNSGERAYIESDPPQPHNYYSVSKHEAEEKLSRISAETGLEAVMLRAPLVYGPEAPGNFFALIKVVSKGLPLPLASIRNRKSFVYIGNLVNAIILCCTHTAAAGNTYLVSDGEDISTPELIRRLANALGRPPRLFPFPPALMRLAGKLTGKTTAVDRLLGSLVVDSGRIRRELGWKPPFTVTEGLRETAEWYITTGRLSN